MQNPIISGFHPDPSTCRVGDAYYLVNSSFEYLPGVPIFRSTNLIEWTQISNVIDRPSQYEPHSGRPSSGFFAPTLRYHDGRFWVVITNIDGFDNGQLILTSETPEGPWSDPVFVPGALGIDPDLAWDDNGTCYLSWASFPAGDGIMNAPVNLTTGMLLRSPQRIWTGTGMAMPEGPHLYRIDDWWYLLIAEGGTERGHAVTIARSRHIEGPFQANPSNPILTHRSTKNDVQNTGHADLVQLVDGSWAMVYLGVRPRGFTPSFHVNGRETFVAGIDWVDGWPEVREDRFAVPAEDHSFVDDFTSAVLDLRWVSQSRPPADFVSRDGRGRLLLASDAASDGGQLCWRTLDNAWTSAARVDGASGTARFALKIDDDHEYALVLDGEGVGVGVGVGVEVTIGALRSTVATAPVDPGTAITLIITATPPYQRAGGPRVREPDRIVLSYRQEDGTDHVLVDLDGRYLSTEVAGGFTGRVLALSASRGTIAVERFSYMTTLAIQS